MNKPNNPPAFPNAEDHKVAADLPWTAGMDLRDYFAAKAMNLYAKPNIRLGGDFTEDAKIFYRIADAMLAERGL